MALRLPVAASLLLSISSLCANAQFTAGNLTILQAAASANNTNASVIELNTTTAGQSPVSATPLPTSGANVFIISGSASSTGYLALSNDGTLLCFTGVNSTATGNVNALNPRVVATLNVSQIFDIAATYTGDVADKDQTRAAATIDDNNWYIGDQGGIYTNNATAPSPSGNYRGVKSFGGAVYVAQQTTTGIGILSAPSGGSIAPLNGLTTNANLVDFYLISSGSNGSSFDVLYILSNDGSKNGGVGTINKYSLVGGSWVANGSPYTTASPTSGGFGLAAQAMTGGANLYISTLDGGTAGNSVVKLIDAAGYNAALSITTANNITLYTAPAAAVIKGIAFTPTGTATPSPVTVNLSLSSNKGSEAAGTVITVTATASAPVNGDQTVSLSVGSIDGVTTDYALSSGTISIPNGTKTGTATFTVIDDAIVEGIETDTLTISNPSAGITLGAATSQIVTIQDNDVSPTLMRITEYMYSGANGEFAEFTNIGSTPIDMTGWSYDDNAHTPGAVSLSTFGIVQPGASVILTETAVDSFRKSWALCNGVGIIGGNTDNLGRNDQINLYDNKGHLVDRLTYGDQNFPGTIRTQNKSGYVSAAAMGIDSIAGWILSVVGDAESSYTSEGGDIGSPGKSSRATVTFDPCFVNPNAPSIAIDVTKTNNYIDGGDTVSPASPYTLSGVIGDLLDPVATQGIYFRIGDPNVAAGQLTVTATSSDPTVVPNANLILTGSDTSRNLLIAPAGVGYTSITVTVNNGTFSTPYVIDYTASLPTFTSPGSSTTWPTGSSDASAAYGIDSAFMVIGDDQQNRLLVYDRTHSGLPITTFDYTANNNLNLPDGTKQIDVEAGTASPATHGRTYWTGSMSNSSSSPYGFEPNRDRLFSVDISGSGAATSFTNRGFVSGLRTQLINWGDKNGYDFTDAAAAGQNPKTINGFNVEGMVFAPDSTTLYMGFRAPLVPNANRTRAVIASILNFETWFNGGNPADTAQLGAPIELNLGGRGIRDMIRLSNGRYVIAAGMYDGTLNPALYLWSGNASDTAVPAPSFDVSGQNAEALIQVNQNGQIALDQLQVISDDGASVLYGDGIEAKDLPELNWQKFSSAVVTSSDPVALPIVFESFTAQRQTSGYPVLLNWTTGIPGSLASFTVDRSRDGASFTDIATIPAPVVQTAYNFIDTGAPATRLYYRIRANQLSGQQTLSTIRAVNGGTSATLIQIYPNPASTGTFTLITPAAGLKYVNIYNSAGALIRQLAYTDTAKDISTATWPGGAYLIRITTSDGTTTTQKLIVR